MRVEDGDLVRAEPDEVIQRPASVAKGEKVAQVWAAQNVLVCLIFQPVSYCLGGQSDDIVQQKVCDLGSAFDG
ncbi:MAG: hypothetical protein WA424_07320 [Candidatus Sulfotelmatobacter sp.]